MSDETKVTKETKETGESPKTNGQDPAGKGPASEYPEEEIDFDEKINAAMEKIINAAYSGGDEEDEEEITGDGGYSDSEEDEDDEYAYSFLKEYKETIRSERAARRAAENTGEHASSEKEIEQASPKPAEKASEEPSGKNQEKQPLKSSEKKAPKPPARSARPQPIGYVPVQESHSDVVEFPPEESGPKDHKGLKAAGLALAIMLAGAGTAYAGVSYYYADRFFNGTMINGIDCSGMTAYQVEEEIAGQVSDYSIQVSSRNLEPQVIDGDTINYRYVSDGSILNYLKSQKPYEWIRGYFEGQTYMVQTSATYDKELLKTQVKELDCAQPENQVEPENAYVAYTDTQFEIIPETAGSMLNLKNAYSVLDAAIADGDTSIDFSEEPEAYVQAEVTSDSESLKSLRDTCNNFTRASVTYTFGDRSVTLDGSVIKDWLQFDDRNQLVQDDASFQQHIAEFVAQVAAEYDTVGTEREFYTTSGRVVYVYGSNYGWKIDQAAEVARLTQEVGTGAQVTREPAYAMTANSHGINDFGDTYIEVDMGEQHMYYYQNGYIIFDSDFVSGNINYPDRATPSGVYTLYFKTSPAVLRGQIDPETGDPEYETEVTFWMPFNGGVGFHDAEWQDYFGGDRYTYAGSHGCINLPYYAAAQLYDIIQYDVPIICFY